MALTAAILLGAASCEDTRGLEVTIVNDTDRPVSLVAPISETLDERLERSGSLPQAVPPHSEATKKFENIPADLPADGEPWCSPYTWYFISPVDPDLEYEKNQPIPLENLEIEVIAIQEMPCFPNQTGNRYVVTAE